MRRHEIHPHDFLQCPWLYKGLVKAEIPEAAWSGISDYLIDRLARGILKLQQGRKKLENFHVVDTRGLLKRARLDTAGESGDWLNETHPDFDGYRKLAKALEVKARRATLSPASWGVGALVSDHMGAIPLPRHHE